MDRIYSPDIGSELNSGLQPSLVQTARRQSVSPINFLQVLLTPVMREYGNPHKETPS
jgi:hypothetical protein